MAMSDRIESAAPLEKEATIMAGGQSLGERRPRDLRTPRRIAAAISIVLGPLAVGVVRATVPLASSSGGQAAIAAVAANLAMVRIELAAGVVASLFLPFAIVGLTRLAALREQLNGNFAVNMLFSVFIIGHELGTLLLGIGLARARVVPLWAAAAVVIGIVLHPISFVVGSRLVDILAYALMTLGCVAAARTVLITPNDAWDLPPQSVHLHR